MRLRILVLILAVLAVFSGGFWLGRLSVRHSESPASPSPADPNHPSKPPGHDLSTGDDCDDLMRDGEARYSHGFLILCRDGSARTGAVAVKVIRFTGDAYELAARDEIECPTGAVWLTEAPTDEDAEVFCGFKGPPRRNARALLYVFADGGDVHRKVQFVCDLA